CSVSSILLLAFLFLAVRRAPSCSFFPYTTLFRSDELNLALRVNDALDHGLETAGSLNFHPSNLTLGQIEPEILSTSVAVVVFVSDGFLNHRKFTFSLIK